MGRFVVQLRPSLSATEAFDRILDLDAHTALIPLTTVRHEGVLGAGRTFVARTGLGRIGFDDQMVVDEFRPPGPETPGRCRIRKTGRWVLGTIDLSVSGDANHAVVLWTQDIRIRWISRVADPVVTAVARVAYRTMLRRLLAHQRA